ncbi:hypothetical protein ABEB36_006520 [Hypothenemus hampei]
MEEIHNMEQFLVKLHNIYAFLSQISFFIMCQEHFNQSHNDFDKNVIVALSTVLFYSVFGYFSTRVRDIYQGNRARTGTHRNPSFINYLKWFCKIVLEWAKAVVIVLCLREQGIHYDPKLSYSIVTFLYYLCTERIFVEVFPQLVEAYNFQSLDSLEHLYVPLVMNTIAITAGLLLALYSFYMNNSILVLLAMYFAVYLRIKDAYFNYYEILVAEREIFSSFIVATRKDIEKWDDICAVCLNNMSKARITPCNHLFHPYCLKQCLRNSFYCPLCKQHFLETRRANK